MLLGWGVGQLRRRRVREGLVGSDCKLAAGPLTQACKRSRADRRSMRLRAPPSAAQRRAAQHGRAQRRAHLDEHEVGWQGIEPVLADLAGGDLLEDATAQAPALHLLQSQIPLQRALGGRQERQQGSWPAQLTAASATGSVTPHKPTHSTHTHLNDAEELAVDELAVG